MKRYCGPTCNVIVEVGTKCPLHQKSRWNSAKATTRIRGRQLQRLRKQLFDKQPLCVACQKQGLVRVATIPDHIQPLAEGGQDIEANTQALCQACSDAKSAAEAQRGIQRQHG